MIPLFRDRFPDSKTELAEALNSAVNRYLQKDGHPVTIHARVFPYLDEIAVNLDGAKMDGALPKLAKVVGETKKACEAALVTVSGRDVSARGVPFNFQMSARDVVIHAGTDESGQAVMLPDTVRAGQVAVSVSQHDLEEALAELAREAGSKQGITVEEVRISLRATGSRSIAADIHLRARKFILRTEMDISGQIEIDDAFQAKASNLKCRATGAIGSVACGVLQPYLDRFEGRSISLMTFPFSKVTLRDVRVTVADTVEVTADFAGVA